MTEPLPDAPNLCWPIDPECLPSRWDEYPQSLKDKATALATSTLFRMCLGQVGGCPVTVRPCNPMLETPGMPGPYISSSAWMRPMLNNGGIWVNCPCEARCGCTSGCEIVFSRFVGRVDEIKVAGTVIDADSYKLVGHERIVWQSTDPCPFLKRQNLDAAAGEPDTMTVTYLPTHPVDGLGAWAAGTLAAEFAKACAADDTCRLPKTVTSVTRQGISYSKINEAFPNGLTGIRQVDAFVLLWNPDPARKTGSPTKVWSPDVAREHVES